MSKIATLSKTIKDLGIYIEGLEAYHMAKAIRDAGRCKTIEAKRAKVERALRQTPIHCFPDRDAGTVVVRYGAKTIAIV